MTLSAFIKKYKGSGVDFDGAYSGQCVDLFRQYVKEVLEFPQPQGLGTGGAKDFWTRFDTDVALKNYYEKIPNTNTFIPKRGDVMLWDKSAGGGYGHIAIVADDAATLTSFTSFDQNWSQLNLCELVSHSYDKPRVLGVFRPKKNVEPLPLDASELQELLHYYKVKDKPELIQTVDTQLKFLADERSANEQLRTDLNNARNDLEQERAAKAQTEKDLKEVWDTIVANTHNNDVKRGDEPSLVAYLTRATQNEDAVVSLQKKYDDALVQHKEDLERQAEKIATLSAAVDRLMQENMKLREEAEKLGSGTPTPSLLERIIRWLQRK